MSSPGGDTRGAVEVRHVSAWKFGENLFYVAAHGVGILIRSRQLRRQDPGEWSTYKHGQGTRGTGMAYQDRANREGGTDRLPIESSASSPFSFLFRDWGLVEVTSEHSHPLTWHGIQPSSSSLLLMVHRVPAWRHA